MSKNCMRTDKNEAASTIETIMRRSKIDNSFDDIVFPTFHRSKKLVGLKRVLIHINIFEFEEIDTLFVPL